jgi:hypothetical protein
MHDLAYLEKKSGGADILSGDISQIGSFDQRNLFSLPSRPGSFLASYRCEMDHKDLFLDLKPL